MSDPRKTQGKMELTEAEKGMNVFDRAPCFNPYHLRDDETCIVCDRPTPWFHDWSGREDSLRESLMTTTGKDAELLTLRGEAKNARAFLQCIESHHPEASERDIAGIRERALYGAITNTAESAKRIRAGIEANIWEKAMHALRAESERLKPTHIPTPSDHARQTILMLMATEFESRARAARKQAGQEKP